MKIHILLLAMLIVATSASEGLCCNRRGISVSVGDRCLFHDEDVAVKIDDGSVVMTNRRTRETIEITERHELYIDDRRVDIDREQAKLLGEYYDGIANIREYAVTIGVEGAKLGARGVALGFAAIARTAKLIRTDYDRRDLERDMERASDKFEARVRRLERMAERLERMAGELEELHGELRACIPALDAVEWF